MEGPPLYVVGVGRAAIGLAGYVVPQLTRQLVGLHHEALPAAPTADHSLDTLTRLFGARDVALGSLMLSEHREVRKAAVWAALFVDVVDGIGTVYQYSQGQLQDPKAILFVVAGPWIFAALGWLMTSGEAKKAAAAKKQ